MIDHIVIYELSSVNISDEIFIKFKGKDMAVSDLGAFQALVFDLFLNIRLKIWQKTGWNI